MMGKAPVVTIGSLPSRKTGAFKIGPFGSSLKKSELVSDGIPVVGIENVLPNEFVSSFRRFVTPEKFDKLSDYEVLPGDVLVTTMGTIGRAAVAPQGLGRVIVDSHLFRMRVDTGRVHPPYLCYAINSSFVADQLSRMARGAIMDGLNTSILKDCIVPLPSLSEQQRIAGLLEQTDRLRRIRRYAIELNDTFLPAAFFRLFGDRLSGWEASTLGEVTTDFRYGTSIKCGADPTLTPVLRIPNVVGGDIDLADLKYAALGTVEKRKLTLEKGDLLFVRTNGNPDYVGRCSVFDLDGDFCFASYLIRVRLDVAAVSTTFLAAFLRTSIGRKSMMPAIRTTAGQYNVSIEGLRDVRIVVPPRPLQEEFVSLVEQQERLRAGHREALRQADHLFRSLLHDAFAGDHDHEAAESLTKPCPADR